MIDTTPKEAASSAPPREGYVLEAHDLHKYFGEASLMDRLTMRQPEVVRAVDDVSLRVRARSTLGLVGESGSGKTTLARLIVGLETADSGSIDLLDLPLKLDLRQRSRDALRDLQMVFQNPNDALNPYMTDRAADRPDDSAAQRPATSRSNRRRAWSNCSPPCG